ncbi:MAG: cobyrinate a,c-diamide synthase [Desulfomonilaceae bacterium]|jgi:cobyrinic acid a,c-diamide synthase
MQKIPRLMLAALRGGAGKTLLTIGITAALRRRGLSVAAFKKGPDYIDAGWLGKAAQSECYNLDAYLFDKETLTASFISRATRHDIAIIEGNRGLFDGVSASGEYSSAELAKMLATPVVLIVDASKMTRTAAALVLGCKLLDPDCSLTAVILNRVAGSRHEKTLRDSIENYCSIPVIGSVNKMSMDNFPQRHLGLLPLFEHSGANTLIEEAANVAESHINLDALLALANSAAPLHCSGLMSPEPEIDPDHVNLRIGVLRDSAFQFYYPENLEALEATGAQLQEITALEAQPIPDLDALYIGGGFPETHAERLAQNTVFKESLYNAVNSGLPVYAECGGLMYLAKELIIDSSAYPMVGVFDVATVLERKPQGHGYMTVQVIAPNPFFPLGTVLSGHEFHYSYICSENPDSNSYAFKVTRGHGITGSFDGIFKNNALGTYLHLHALGAPEWAKSILKVASTYHKTRVGNKSGQ